MDEAEGNEGMKLVIPNSNILVITCKASTLVLLTVDIIQTVSAYTPLEPATSRRTQSAYLVQQLQRHCL